MTATDAQVRIALRERSKGKTQEQAAAKAGLRDRGTVSKYERGAPLPSEAKGPRTYRTRRDPFAQDWARLEAMLEVAPSLEAKALFEWLCTDVPGRYQEGQLRTFQRRVSRWRALNVPKMVELAQEHEPGEVMQTDGTWMKEMGITLAGEAFEHILVHSVLPYSNWEWATVAQSESLMAVNTGFQTALRELGHVPLIHQTDSSTAATHKLGAGDEEALRSESGRGYNEGYLAVVQHHGVTPRTTHLGASDENGDVEALHGALKRALEQHLLLRGSRDFESLAAYEAFLHEVMRRRNRLRQDRVDRELAAMRPLKTAPLSTRRELRPKVSRQGTIRILQNVYSVPSGLVGKTVIALVGEWEIEVYYDRQLIQSVPRLVGSKQANVNYRHVLPTLLRKPGGFRRYRYRDQLYPSTVFRRAWDALDARMSPRQADLALSRDGVQTTGEDAPMDHTGAGSTDHGGDGLTDHT